MTKLLRVCLIGPECTGKTTLAEGLAAHYATAWVPEYAREYALRVARPLTFDDADAIGRGQAEGEERYGAGAEKLLILDTDLISTAVYSRFYYGEVPSWIAPEAARRKAHLYLLFDCDVPFVEDPARDAAEHRPAQFELFRRTLEEHGANVVVVSGSWSERRRQAIEAIERELQRHGG